MGLNNFNGIYREPIAIIGIGVVLPKAFTVEAFWQNILNKVDCIIEVPKERWDPEIYYSPDINAPDKTYSKIGGFITGFKFNPLEFKIPPAVAERLDLAQKTALIAARDALKDSGYDKKSFEPERASVIIGNSGGGDLAYITGTRLWFQQIQNILNNLPEFQSLPLEKSKQLFDSLDRETKRFFGPSITEDSMPGELSNTIPGRISNKFGMMGPNFSCDAACASSFAALAASVHHLWLHEVDLAVSGGVDNWMSPVGFIKFSKIGALSANGSFPFDARADGFVMGEGTGVYLLKRLSDAVKDGDKIYGLIRNIGASSDGKGKGITAPNPKGQILAIKRAFQNVDYTPDTIQLIEAHGTATKIGDVIEVMALREFFEPYVNKKGVIGIGSVKSNIGHLKSAAGMASLIKTALGLYYKILPPSINYETPNPALEIEKTPFYVNTEVKEWPKNKNNLPRRANISAFGFGGTNFHVLLEEYIPGYSEETYSPKKNIKIFLPDDVKRNDNRVSAKEYVEKYIDLEGEAFVIGGDTYNDLKKELTQLLNLLETSKLFGKGVEDGIRMTEIAHPLRIISQTKPLRVGFAVSSWDELKKKINLSLEAVDDPKKRGMYNVKGIFFGDDNDPNSYKIGKIGFLFPGQGSQYINMCRNLYRKYKYAKEIFNHTEKELEGVISKKLLEILFLDDEKNEKEISWREEMLKDVDTMQSLMLASGISFYKILEAYGVKPDVVMGHSMGEYTACVAAGVMSYDEALTAVSARSKNIREVKIEDPGKMASIGASAEIVEEIIKDIPGYVIVANKNCYFQTVIAGHSKPVEEAVKKIASQGIDARFIPVSHAFHCDVVAPAAEPLKEMLRGFNLKEPKIPILSNVNADYYPTGEGYKEKIIELLGKQICYPVEFMQEIERMYQDGVRFFLEVGPKKTLASFVDNILRRKKTNDFISLSIDHPRKGEIYQLNEVLALLSAYGHKVNWEGKEIKKNSEIYNELYTDFITEEEKYQPPVIKDEPLKSEVVEKKEEVKTETSPQSKSSKTYNEAFVIGGQNANYVISEIEKLISNYNSFLNEPLGNIAQPLRIKASSLPFKVGFSASSHEDFKKKLEMSLEAIKDPNKAKLFQAKGIFISESIDKNVIGGKIGFLFPGQGSQYANMCKELYEKYDCVKEVFDRADKVMNQVTGKSLSKIIFSDDANAEEILKQTEITQPAMLLCDVAVLTVLEKLGIYPSVVAGHSLGEYAAAVAAKVLSFEDALHAVIIRGNAMASVKAYGGDPGKMASISAPESKVKEILESVKGYVVIANKNCYMQTVIAGESAAVETAVTLFQKNNINAQFLNVSNAFHTKIVAKAAEPVRKFLEQVNISSPQIPILSNVYGDYYPTGKDVKNKIVDILSEQITSSVEFVKEIERMYQDGVRIFVEVGPKKALSSFVDNILQGKPYLSFCSVHPKKGELTQFNELLAALACCKVDIDWEGKGKEIKKELFIERERKILSEEEKIGQIFIDNEILELTKDKDFIPYLISQKEAILEFIKSNFKSHKNYMAEALEIVDKVRSFSMYVISKYPEFFPELKRIESKGEEIPKVLELPKVLEKPKVEVKLEPEKVLEVPKVEVKLEPEKVLEKPGQMPKVVQEPPKEPKISEKMGRAEIAKKIIKMFSEKTGYPEEMLDPSLDMEADLGIDTVKQAELFGSMRKEFNIPFQQGLQIKDFPTLNHVIDFVVKIIGEKEEVKEKEEATKPSQIEPPKTEKIERAEIAKKIIKMFSEKTGYPEEMLDPSLDMEADLGIDTVKQAELFGSMRKEFNIPFQQGLQIKDFPTLNHVIDFVVKIIGEKEIPKESEKKEEQKPQILEEKPIIDEKIKRLAVEVIDLPDIPITNEKISTQKGAIIIVDDGKGLADEIINSYIDNKERVVLIGKYISKRDDILTVDCDLSSLEILKQGIETVRKKLGKIFGVIYLAGFGDKISPIETDYETWHKQVSYVVKGCFNIAKETFKDLDELRGFLASPIRIDGTHGYTNASLGNPLNGGITGIIKSIAKESVPMPTITEEGIPVSSEPETIRCKVVDFSPDIPIPDVAKLFVSELLSDDKRIEVGYLNGKRKGLKVSYVNLSKDRKPFPFDSNSVILFTGAGMGITGEIAKEVAKRFKPKIIILDWQSLPENIEELAKLDEEGLKKVKDSIINELKSKGEKVTPVRIEQEYGFKVSRPLTVYNNIKAMEKFGSPVTFFSLDAGDRIKSEEVFAKLAEKFPKIDVMVHGAGVEESKLILDKSEASFDRTMQGKIYGLFNLLKNVQKFQTNTFIGFSSIAGRFGNYGQTDYAAANEILNKTIASINASKELRGIAINWTAWDQIGVAMKGGTKKIMEMAKVDMIQPAVGIEYFINELLYNLEGEEPIIAGYMGPIDHDQILNNLDKRASVINLENKIINDKDSFPFIDEIIEFIPDKKIVVKKLLTPKKDLFLKDHSLGGTPLLPGVMGIEAFAQVSSILFPNMVISSADNIFYKQPVKVFEENPLEIFITAEKKDENIAYATIESYFKNRKGEIVGDKRLHFSGEIIFSNLQEKSPIIEGDLIKGGFDPKIVKTDIYQETRFFHGKTFQVLEKTIALGDNTLITQVNLPDKNNLFSFTERPNFKTNPLLVEALFQSAGLFDFLNDRGALPNSVKELKFYEGSFEEPFYTKATFLKNEEKLNFYKVEAFDKNGKVILESKEYTTIKLADIPFSIRMNKGVEVSKIEIDSFNKEKLDDFLSNEEIKYFNNLNIEKRKNEYLAGRLAVKQAIKRYIERREEDKKISLKEIEIVNNENGEPVLSNFPKLKISLSHSQKYAVGAVTSEDIAQRIGIDIEKIEQRENEFEKDYFTSSEQKLIEEINKNYKIDKNRIITQFWTVKEAVSKCLGVGLKLNLLDIEIINLDKLGKCKVIINNELSKKFKEIDVQCTVEDDYVTSIVLMK